MSRVRLDNVSKAYDRVWAVRDIGLTADEGEFISLLGPSGCGKTTTLRLIAGFVFPDAGRVFIGDEDVTRVSPSHRNAGVVFQNYALFPHMTVAQNVNFGLKMRRCSGSEARARLAEVLALVRLEHLADRLPRQLSGGQQQRVALARAVVIHPRVLLMDEPLGALDLKLRQDLQVQIRKVQRALGITTIYVTHDQGEALSLSDRVAVMRDGGIAQLAPPEALYRQPNSAFVANFVGRANLVPIVIIGPDRDGQYCRARPHGADGREFLVPSQLQGLPPRQGEHCLLGFRLEHAALETGATNELTARVDDIRYFGAIRSVSLTGELGLPLEVDLASGSSTPSLQEIVRIGWEPAQSFLVPAES